mgnify:CR=1 FL=1
MQKKIEILGTKFDTITKKQASEIVDRWLSENRKRYIVTPNPEIVLKAEKDKEYKKIINRADLSIADGTGILWASKFRKILLKKDSTFKKFSKWAISLAMIPISKEYIETVIPERITGVDFMKEICKKAAKRKNRVFLLGAAEGVAKLTAKKLQKDIKNLKISGTYSGTAKKKDDEEIIKIINRTSPEVLFVAYGAPEQEKWIHRNYKKIPNLKIAMGVGGAFDFISGRTKRAPRKIQKLGLEWAYRLYKQPSRIKRIINATKVFPVKMMKKR